MAENEKAVMFDLFLNFYARSASLFNYKLITESGYIYIYNIYIYIYIYNIYIYIYIIYIYIYIVIIIAKVKQL